MVFSDLNSASGHTGSIAIPLGTPAGTHRMRVMSQYSPNSFPSDGCGYVGYFGETQDYNIEVLTEAFPYCKPYGGGCTPYDCSIQDFTFNTIQDLASGCSAPDNYINTGLSTNVIDGQTYTFSTTYGLYPEVLAMYIDFNQDNDFGDSGEMVFVDYNLENQKHSKLFIGDL
jgi:hypothetical protein